MNILFWLGQWIVLCWTIIFIHECGHYCAARFARVPKENIHIQMLQFPQHVALRNSDGLWISPWQQPIYGQLCWQYFHGNRSMIILYVGAGLIVQSLFVLFGTWLLLAARLYSWAFSLFILSVQITAIYFLAELIFYSFRRKPFGDFSALWILSKPAFCLICVSVVILHAAAFLVFYIRH